ncbi:hypothetical protein TIFTF001_010020 [Ficus carica]|uniref:C-JID domain-containing protein n=1 Tax=Ficus carica TaxID=3494 RepID=A0AA87ZR07_FICCA|nr:hypothetical protein TIFTF001_010020 [Ficus carica]
MSNISEVHFSPTAFQNMYSLREVPSYLQHLHELKTLTLEGCSSVDKFPKLPKSIICLVLSRTAIKSVPSSIESLSCLEILNLNYCEKLKRIPCFSKVTKGIKFIMLDGTSLGRRPSRLPWWIREVVAHSHLSFYEHSEQRAILKEPAGCVVSTKELRKQNPDFLRVLAGRHLFYNCIPLHVGERCNIAKTYIGKLKILFRNIALQEFAGGLPIKPEIGVCCRGNEIPEWFHYQASRRTVQEMATFGIKEVVDFIVDLPTNLLGNPNLLGFALCVACDLNFPQPSPIFKKFRPYLNLECTPSFILNNGNTLSWNFCYDDEVDDEEEWFTVREKVTKVVFRFSLFQENSSGESFCVGRVNECRIRLLYTEDVNKFNELDYPEEEEEEEEEDYGCSSEES